MKVKEKKRSIVMLAIPSYDGMVPVGFVSSIMQSYFEYGAEYDIRPMFLPGDSLLIRARNDLFRIAYRENMDELVWIDGDMFWNPPDLYALLKAPADFVGAAYRKKQPQIIFTVNPLAMGEKVKVSQTTQLAEVRSLATGFLRLNKRAIHKIWDYSPKYFDPRKKNDPDKGETASVFETTMEPDRGIIGEDTYLCDRWREHGEKVYLHTGIELGHLGNKIFSGKVNDYFREYDLYEEVP